MTIKEDNNYSKQNDEPDIDLNAPSNYGQEQEQEQQQQETNTSPFSQALDNPPPATAQNSIPEATATYIGTGADYAKPSNNYDVSYDVEPGYSSSPTAPVASTTDTAAPTGTGTGTGTAINNTTTNMPAGAPPGGQWVLTKFIGPQTWSIAAVTGCLLCFFCAIILGPCGLWALACPCDETRAYMAPNGDLYDPKGKVIGHRDKNKWQKL